MPVYFEALANSGFAFNRLWRQKLRRLVGVGRSLKDWLKGIQYLLRAAEVKRVFGLPFNHYWRSEQPLLLSKTHS